MSVNFDCTNEVNIISLWSVVRLFDPVILFLIFYLIMTFKLQIWSYSLDEITETHVSMKELNLIG